MSNYPTVEQTIGNTPLVALQRMQPPGVTVLLKLEGNNPAGSVKDRPALNMIKQAELRGHIKHGDTLIEATSGNTGIALAMVAAIKAYRLILIMPETMSVERRAIMKAYGAEIILVDADSGMEGARDMALQMQQQGRGKVLDQFANPDNPNAHYTTTGPEIWQASRHNITHFVSSMGTTGTVMGAGQFLKEQNPNIEIIGVEPSEGSKIPGIRKWPPAYLPKIFNAKKVDRTIQVSQAEAEQTMRELAAREGIFCGVSSGGCTAAALRVATSLSPDSAAVIVAVACDRGDRYLSTGVFPA